MMRFCSVHTHSICCDGKNTLTEMARAAYEAGAVSFGASGHSHTPLPEDEGCVLPADMSAYRAEVLRLREACAGQMDVLLGIELDNCADVSAEGFDYWIGSVHRLKAPDGQYYTVDWSPEILSDCRWEVFGGDAYAMAECYYTEVRKMAAMKPTILGHLDLITKFNEKAPCLDEESSRYRAAALDALHAADPDATLLEINTAPCPVAGGLHLTRPGSFWKSGGIWAGRSFLPPTLTVRTPSFTRTRKPQNSPAPQGTAMPSC